MKKLPVEYFEKQLQEIIDCEYPLSPLKFRTYKYLKEKIERMKKEEEV